MIALSKESGAIQNDGRIDAEDVRFCQVVQISYEQTHAMLVRVAREISDYGKKRKKFLNDTGIHDAEFLYDYSVNPVFERLDSLPVSFVYKLAHYFSHKYDVRIEPEKICANLVPQRPKEPKLYSCYVSRERSDFADLN